MELRRPGTAILRKSNNLNPPFQPIENLAKKRPSSTKLDIEKMYEESMELATRYKQLLRENKQLKEQYSKVEAVKHSRQNLISTVEKIVEEKSKELKNKNKQKFSWLVHNLNNKISDLKAKIENKQKHIHEISQSKESVIISEKQRQIEQLSKVIEDAKEQGIYKVNAYKDPSSLSDIKEIVWMEQELRQKEQEISAAQVTFRDEEKQVKKLMEDLAAKKAELKSIKELESQYTRAQQLFKQEKRKKEQRIAGNKTYLEQLQNQKSQELAKLQALKTKFNLIEKEERSTIQDLKGQLDKLRTQYQLRVRIKQQTQIKLSEKKIATNSKKYVKRVPFEQIKNIAGNVNYTLALKGVSHSQIANFFPDSQEQYSIEEVSSILQRQPFSIEDESQAIMMARYTVEDAGDGYFLEDMDTSQSVHIIRSILAKLIGQVKIFSRQRSEELRQQIGSILFKFGKLVQQSLDQKDSINFREGGKKNRVSKEAMVDALENSLSSLQSETFLHQQIDFTIFYLFSWSRDLQKLEVRRIFTMCEDGINWPSVE